MACESFPLFAQLPYHLREQIWHLAMAVMSPRAHAFTLFSFRRDAFSAPLQYGLLESGCQDDFHGLAPPGEYHPAGSVGRGSTWEPMPPAAYRAHMNVWDSCREAREIMQRDLGALDWHDRRARSLAGPLTPRDEAAPVVWRFLADDHCQPFLAFPKHDLFYLRPFDFATIEWRELNCCLWILQLGVRHVALEYDPAWAMRSPQPLSATDYDRSSYDHFGPEQCAEMLISGLLDRTAHLWFIHCGLTLSSPVAPNPQRHIFPSAGHTFVEVLSTDACQSVSRDGIDIFDYVRGLAYAMHVICTPPLQPPPKIVVLACLDYISTRKHPTFLHRHLISSWCCHSRLLGCKRTLGIPLLSESGERCPRRKVTAPSGNTCGVFHPTVIIFWPGFRQDLRVLLWFASSSFGKFATDLLGSKADFRAATWAYCAKGISTTHFTAFCNHYIRLREETTHDTSPGGDNSYQGREELARNWDW